MELNSFKFNIEKDIFKTYKLGELNKKYNHLTIIGNLIYDKSIVIIYGVAGCGKTCFVLNMILSIDCLSIDKYLGLPIKRHGKTLYISGEGLSGLCDRTTAWCHFNEIKTSDINTIFLPIENTDINDPINRFKFFQTINSIVSDNEDLVFIVIDTISNLNISENSSSTVNKFISGMKKCIKNKNICILLVHHSGKNEKKGLRGSSNFSGIADTIIKLNKSTNKKEKVFIDVEKQKDGNCIELNTTLLKVDNSIILINDE